MLAEGVQRHLVPLVLHNDDVAFWPELPRETAWGGAAAHAGLTCLAAGPLRGPHETVGIVWVARRGGEGLERHHLHLLETLIPTIAARLHIVELEQRLQKLALADTATHLPSRDTFDLALRQAAADDAPFAVLAMELQWHDPATDSHAPLSEDRHVHAVVEQLQTINRRSNFLARLGPNRLGMLVPGIDAERARALAERLQASIAEQPLHLPHEQPVTVRATVGLAHRPDDGEDAGALCELAIERAQPPRSAALDASDSDDTSVTRRRQVG